VPARRIAFIEAHFEGSLELRLVAAEGAASATRRTLTRSRRATELPAEQPDPD
jgi:hypothetical protein